MASIGIPPSIASTWSPSAHISLPAHGEVNHGLYWHPALYCQYLESLSSYLTASPPVRSTMASIGIPPSVASTWSL